MKLEIVLRLRKMTMFLVLIHFLGLSDTLIMKNRAKAKKYERSCHVDHFSYSVRVRVSENMFNDICHCH